MSTLLQTLANNLDEQTLRKMSQAVGADEGQTERAISAALPMLLGALGRNASNPQGAQALTSALQRDHDGSIFNNLAAQLTNPSTLQDGMAILNHVLGGKKEAVATGVGNVSGLSASATSQLLTMLAPMVLGALGQMQRQENLDADQVASVLKKEREETESSLGGLAKLLDMDGDGSVIDDVMTIGSSLLKGIFGKR